MRKQYDFKKIKKAKPNYILQKLLTSSSDAGVNSNVGVALSKAISMELRFLKPSDEQTFRAAVAEFKTHDPDWEFAFFLDDARNFAEYTALLRNQSEGKDLRGFVPNSYMGAFVNGKCVGRASIRHELNDRLLVDGGHVGYGVVASERRKGYAREILRQSLAVLKAHGVKRALVTCADDNLGSIRTIEANGGVLENKIPRHGTTGGLTSRYWIDIDKKT